MNKYIIYVGVGLITLAIISLLIFYYMVEKTKRELKELVEAEALENELDKLVENQDELHKYLTDKSREVS